MGHPTGAITVGQITDALNEKKQNDWDQVRGKNVASEDVKRSNPSTGRVESWGGRHSNSCYRNVFAEVLMMLGR